MASSTSSPGPFDRFLHWLSPDRDKAVQEFEEIRKKLTRYFALKGCPGIDLEDLRDKTLDRVLQIEERWHEYPNARACCFGVARYIKREYDRRLRPDPIEDYDPPSPSPDWPHQEQELQCLEKCLGQLPEDDRNLITRFYEGQGRQRIELRKHLAKEHGGAGNLRVKAFRVRAGLRTCVTGCLTERMI